MTTNRPRTGATTMAPVIKSRLGECYALTNGFVMDAMFNDPEAKWSVVHGTITGERLPGTGLLLPPLHHAFAWWVEAGLIYEPTTNTVYEKDAFDRLYRPTYDHVFGPGERDEDGWRRTCLRYGHHGPWDGTCPPTPTDYGVDGENDEWDDGWGDDD